MNKLYHLCLIAGCLILATFPSVAQKKAPHRLGTVRTFSTDLKQHINASENSRLRSALSLKVSDKESLPLKVNFKKSENIESQYLVGEIEGKEGSSFLLNVNGNKLEGSIILKKENKAFKYYSDASGNAYVEPTDINSLLCVNYDKHAHADDATSTKKSSSSMRTEALTNLQSLPGARGCVLLDFDGHYVSGTYWNSGNPINAAPSGMSDAAIQESWEIVAEDFRPFNLNITTNEAVFNSYPKNMRMRCIITPTNTAAPGAGGVAYIGSFSWNDDTPCWVFMTGAKSSAEASSHEIGHTFDLGHDGRTTPNEGYFVGHGDWAPIMGVGYYRPISQWSKGEYNFANQKQDDVAIIAGTKFGVGFRNDDHSNGTAGATALTRSGTSVSGSGIITNEADWDFFSLNVGAGTISLNVNTVGRHGNLDIVVRLHNSAGTVIGTYNPAGLNATVSANVAAGTYYVSVDGTGAGNPATDGYSAYASLGSYWISGSAPSSTSTPPPPTGVVTLYQHCSYGGYAVGLPVGDYPLSALISRGLVNDDVSSIRVNSGYEVIVYQNDNYGGTAVTFTGSDDCLVDNGINDWVSSVRVRARATSFSTTIQAENYTSMAGIQTEGTTDAGGGLNVGWIDINDWMAYNGINIPTTGSYRVEYRVASPNTGGQLSLDINAGATVLGTVNIPNTGGWQTWTTVSHTMNINAGTYNFGIFARAGGWNINWWRITSAASGARIVGSGDLFNEAAIDLYPNPAASKLKISSLQDFSGAQIKIFDSKGVVVVNTTFNTEDLDVSGLKQGIYSMMIIHNGKKITKRLVKN